MTTKGETMTTRRFLVFDGDGELVATFPEWESAHGWAHLRSVEPLTPQPVQVEDREKRQTWTIESGRCRLTVWRRHVEYGHCVSSGCAPTPVREPALAS
jgi:NADH:ubiquinone oxidoreductase subunit